jgi:hypothetical protein
MFEIDEFADAESLEASEMYSYSINIESFGKSRERAGSRSIS